MQGRTLTKHYKETVGWTNKLTKAILLAVIFVAQHLLEHKAVLLPWVCQKFLQAYEISYTGNINQVNLILEMGESSVMFSSRWPLKQLIGYLNPYMLCKCIHMKYGTILYRKGIDTLVSLSWALGACSSTHLDEAQSISESISKESRQRQCFMKQDVSAAWRNW